MFGLELGMESSGLPTVGLGMGSTGLMTIIELTMVSGLDIIPLDKVKYRLCV